MKAMLVENEKLVLTEVEMPEVKADEIRIKIKAIGINRADLLQKKAPTLPRKVGLSGPVLKWQVW